MPLRDIGSSAYYGLQLQWPFWTYYQSHHRPSSNNHIVNCSYGYGQSGLLIHVKGTNSQYCGSIGALILSYYDSIWKAVFRFMAQNDRLHTWHQTHPDLVIPFPLMSRFRQTLLPQYESVLYSPGKGHFTVESDREKIAVVTQKMVLKKLMGYLEHLVLSWSHWAKLLWDGSMGGTWDKSENSLGHH